MNFVMEPSFGFGFDVFSILFGLVFLVVIGTFVMIFIQSIGQWNRNNHAPRLTVSAAVVTKRTDVTRHSHDHNHHTTSTSYYVTFQVDSGDRMEFHVSGQEYGMLVEGDQGNLSFQGTRYLGFERG